MKTIKSLLVLFVILFIYGFTFSHYSGNNRDVTFTEILSKRNSNYSLTSYLAFSHWLENIEKGEITRSDDSAINQDWLSTVIENIKRKSTTLLTVRNCLHTSHQTGLTITGSYIIKTVLV